MMNKPITLCERCEEYAICLLEFDGKSCREIRNVEPTNADRFRAMNDEELAKYLWNIRNAERCVISDKKRCIMFDDCIACWLDWLKQEAE